MPFNCAITGGLLPPGLNITSLIAETSPGFPITGTPTAPGVYRFKLKICNTAAGIECAEREFVMSVIAAVVKRVEITTPADLGAFLMGVPVAKLISVRVVEGTVGNGGGGEVDPPPPPVEPPTPV